jgi:hypothetical protein
MPVFVILDDAEAIAKGPAPLTRAGIDFLPFQKFTDRLAANALS